MHVTFPEFKMGEEVVREIAEPPSYGMYDDYYYDDDGDDDDDDYYYYFFF